MAHVVLFSAVDGIFYYRPPGIQIVRTSSTFVTPYWNRLCAKHLIERETLLLQILCNSWATIADSMQSFAYYCRFRAIVELLLHAICNSSANLSTIAGLYAIVVRAVLHQQEVLHLIEATCQTAVLEQRSIWLASIA